jgi:hypothetical protein
MKFSEEPVVHLCINRIVSNERTVPGISSIFHQKLRFCLRQFNTFGEQKFLVSGFALKGLTKQRYEASDSSGNHCRSQND